MHVLMGIGVIQPQPGLRKGGKLGGDLAPQLPADGGAEEIPYP